MKTKENLYYKTGACLLVLALLLRLAAAQTVQRQLFGLAENPSFTRLLLRMELGNWDSPADAEDTSQEPSPQEVMEPAESDPAELPQVAASVDRTSDLGRTVVLPAAPEEPGGDGQAEPSPEPEENPEIPAEETPDEALTKTPVSDPFDPQILIYSPAAAGEKAELSFMAADLAAIGELNNRTDYEPDLESLLQAPAALAGSGDGPQVLIVHTHGTESYTPASEGLYEESDPFHTLDAAYNVTGLGTVLAETLQAAGIGVVHDTAYHDYPAYDGSYTRTGERIRELLERYPSIGLVIDLHRDCVQTDNGDWLATAQTPDGPARLMLVVGTDAGGLSHPDWQKNLAMALQVQALTLRLDGGLCRSVNLRTERFNQQLAPTLLAEIGACGDTWDQAARTVEIFGQALAMWLNG